MCNQMFLKMLAMITSVLFSFSLQAAVIIDQEYKNHPDMKFHVSIDEKVFKKKIKKPLTGWQKEQIQADFEGFKQDGISLGLVDQIFHSDYITELKLLRIKKQQQKIFYSIDEECKDIRFYNVLNAVEKLCQISDLPDFDCIISLHDSLAIESPVPIFVFAKPNYIKSLPLIPDFEALGGHEHLRKEVNQGNKKYSWDDKKNRIFWRGSSTGGLLNENNWFLFPRCRLALISATMTGMINAKITNIVDATPGVAEALEKNHLLGDYVKPKDQLKYKYLIDVDGNSCSYSRFFWLLMGNSLVFKQMTPNIQWYYRGLTPWKHYVPVKEDFSDIVEQFFWAEGNGNKGLKIIKHANEFVEENLSTEDIYAYLYFLLKEYMSLVK